MIYELLKVSYKKNYMPDDSAGVFLTWYTLKMIYGSGTWRKLLKTWRMKGNIIVCIMEAISVHGLR